MPSESFDSYFRGMLQRKHPRAVHPGYVNEALNVAFIGGTPVSRPGIRPFTGVKFSGNVRGMGWHVDDTGFRELLVAAGAAFQRAVEGGDPVNLPLTNLPAVDQTRTEPERVNFLSLSGGAATTIIYDGVNQNLKWTGTALTKLGFVRGTTPPAPTIAGGGNIDAGTRDYVITFFSTLHEGDPSATPTSVTNAAGQQNTFASPVQGVDFDDPQISEWRLYRTRKGAKDFFFVGSADIGLPITDNVADDDLDAGTPLEELRNTAPPAPFVAMCEHRGQVVGVTNDDLNIIRFSNFDEQYMVPEGWPADWVWPVAHGDGDEIRALVSFHEYIVVFKTNGAWALSGTWPDFQIVPVLAAGGGKRIGIGVNAPGSILQIENQVIFASRDGIYALERGNGVEATRLSGPIDDLYAAARFSLGAATSFDRKRRLFVMWGHG